MPVPLGRSWVAPRRGIRYPLETFQPPPPPIPANNPAPPSTAAWTLQRGIRFQPRMAAMQVPYSYMFASDVSTGTLIFGGSSVDWLAQQGAAPQQQQAWVLRRGIMNRPQAAAMQVKYSYTFNADFASGTLIFGGSSSESKTGSDGATGTFIFGGSSTSSLTHAASVTGTLIFGGSSSDVYTPPNTGVTFSQFQIATFLRVGP